MHKSYYYECDSHHMSVTLYHNFKKFKCKDLRCNSAQELQENWEPFNEGGFVKKYEYV